MTKQALTRRLLVPLALVFFVLFFSGCWGETELDSLFIVTGVALDPSDDPEKMNITFQVAKTQSGPASGSGDASSTESATILLKTKRGTVAEGIADFNRDSSRKIFIQHNQVILIGSSLAEEGISDRIDLFVRDEETRMEVPIVIVDGEAEGVLAVEMDQDKISGLFLSHVMERQGSVSNQYRTRLLDFASRIIDESSSPVAPIAQVVKIMDKDEILITGMAVFKDDKLIGRLTNDETLGYIWTMGGVKNSSVAAEDDAGKAVFIIDELNSKRTLALREDGGVGVKISVDALLSVNELSGFSEMAPLELINHLIELSQDTIRQRIADTFETARNMKADIYEFGVSAHRKFPKEWRQMSDRWDDYFAGIEFEVEVKARIPSTGKVIKSLKMEEGNYDY